MDKQIAYNRYQRQLILKGFGEDAQQKLAAAKVLVIGVGGLGCPLLQYLVATGVGQIGIADDDLVSLSNLHRQVLYSTPDIGRLKVDVAKEKMGELNEEVRITTYPKRWSKQDCVNHFPAYDVIVDATDNFASRYLINDACVLLGKTLVFGAVSQYEGQLAVFNGVLNNGERSVSYRDIFPEPPKDGEVLNCAEAGVLGVLPGVIGTMQAAEVIKLITGIGSPLLNKLLNYNALTQDFFTLTLDKHPDAQHKIPSSEDEYMKMDYEALCSIAIFGIEEITVNDWLKSNGTALLVDIREPHELPKLKNINHLVMPLSSLDKSMDILIGKEVIFVCQAGKRSLKAASMLKLLDAEAKVFSLEGGVDNLVKQKIISS